MNKMISAAYGRTGIIAYNNNVSVTTEISGITILY